MARRCLTLLAVLGAGLSAACTAEDTGPGPVTSTASKEWTRVSTPKSVDKNFRTKPCEALTPAERRDLGLPSSPTAAAPEESAGCTWRDQDRGVSVLVELDTLALAQRYDQTPESRGLTVFKLSGFPAVRGNPAERARECEIRVGVSATEALHIRFSAPRTGPDTDACGLAQRVTEAVLRTLPEGS